MNETMNSGKDEEIASKIDLALADDTVSDFQDFPEIEKGFSLAGRYRLDSKLGEGGMGIVLGGYDEQLERKIAIKLVKPSLSQNKASVDQLRQEAKVAMMLTHPAIMRLINFEQDDKYTFLLMEYVEGVNLGAFRKSMPEERLKGDDVANIGYKICKALEYAHNKNVIHRDIKPANVMIDPGHTHLKLMDFGIARTLVYESGQRPKISGTLAFIAPEVFEGELPDKRADIYALGLTLYELAAGRLAFRGKNAGEIIEHHKKTVPEPLDEVDPRLSKIIFQCIEKKPNARFQTAKDLSGALARYLDLDDRAKMSRMQGAMDIEKRSVAREMRKLEREKEKLEIAKRKFQETTSDLSGVLTAETSDKEWMEAIKGRSNSERGKLFIPFAALLAGAFAAYIGGMVADGEIMYFKYAENYEMFSSITICLIAISVPSWLKFGRSGVAIGPAIGIIMGYIGFLSHEAYTFYSIENQTTIPFDLVAFMTLAIPIAMGVAIIHIDNKRLWHSFAIAIIAIIAAIGSTGLPSIHFADQILGVAEENVNYIYLPLLSLFLWGSIELWESFRGE